MQYEKEAVTHVEVSNWLKYCKPRNFLIYDSIYIDDDENDNNNKNKGCNKSSFFGMWQYVFWWVASGVQKETSGTTRH